MKKTIILVFTVLLLSFCQKPENNIQMETASAPLTEKEYLIEAKVISEMEYLIVCKGYPKAGLTDSVQMAGTAKEAALLYAQFAAQKRLKNIDISKGTIQKYEFNGEYGTIYYVIQAENIDMYVK
jgi:hypothetical protein